MSVSIKEINDLRKITGAGLMNCQKWNKSRKQKN